MMSGLNTFICPPCRGFYSWGLATGHPGNCATKKTALPPLGAFGRASDTMAEVVIFLAWSVAMLRRRRLLIMVRRKQVEGKDAHRLEQGMQR